MHHDAGTPYAPAAWVQESECNVGTVLLADIGVHGRYRKENDAQHRALGYHLMKWPYIPFKGAIVTDHPHLPLEILRDDPRPQDRRLGAGGGARAHRPQRDRNAESC